MAASVKASRYLSETPEFTDTRDGSRRVIVYSTREREGRVLDSRAWRNIKIGHLDEIPTRHIEDLLAVKILVPSAENEAREVIAELARSRRCSRTLPVTIIPSAYCQCSCVYCGQANARARMNAANQNLLVGRIEKKLSWGKYEQLVISWFGREPLTGLRVIESLTPRLRAAAARFGCAYRAKAATNGLLLTEAVATPLVKSLGFKRVCVTLDGPADVHDRRRFRRSRRPTFHRTLRNLVAFARRQDLSEAVLAVRCNVDRENRDRFPELLDILKNAGIHRRIALEIALVHDWDNSAGRDRPSPQEAAEWEMGALLAMFEREFVIHLLPSRCAPMCIALSQDGELVDPYGVLFECSERCLLQRDFQALGRAGTGQNPFDNRFSIGDLRCGTDPSKRVLAGFYDRLRAGEFGECAKCFLLPVCGGACPKSWFEGCRKPCPPMRYNLPQRLLMSHAIGSLAACGVPDKLPQDTQEQFASPACVT